MQRCELAVECCVCDVALCPYDDDEERYLRGELEWDEISHEFIHPEDVHGAAP